MAGPLPVRNDDMDDAEDAPMLARNGAGNGNGNGNPQKEKHRPAPRHRGIAWFLGFGLCCFLTLVALTGVLVSGFFADPPPPPNTPEQQQPPSSVVSSPPPPPPPPPPAPPPASLEDQLNLKTAFLISSTPQTRHITLNITLGPTSPDGVPTTGILINNQSPGPLIEANTGDTLRITVHNHLPPPHSTTLHWHGIDQHLSNPMDGVLSVTQCPIPGGGGSFTYIFTLPDQRGTFWYHSHSTLQLARGLYGPLVVHDPGEMVPGYEDDKLVLLGDLFHSDPDELLPTYLVGVDAGTEPMPDNILLNGRGVSNCSSHGECADGELFRTTVRKGETVRLRVVSVAASLPYYFGLDGHTLRIVEVDGVEVEPVATTRVFVNPGQRYSVLVEANQTVGAYRMRATAARGCFHRGKGSLGLDGVGWEGAGVLVYDGAGEEEVGVPWDLLAKENELFGEEPWGKRCRDLPFERAKPVRAVGAFEVGRGNEHVFTFSRETGEEVVQSFINEVSFFLDGVGGGGSADEGQTNLYEPLKGDATLWRVMDALKGGKAVDTTNATAEDVFGPGQLVMVSQDPTKGAQIVINSDAMMMHPFHLQ